MAIHLGIEKIMITLPDLEEADSVDNLARILNRYLEEVTIMQKFIVKLTIPGDDEEAEKVYSRYLQLKALCNYSTRLSIILCIQPNLPGSISNEDLLYRYWGEPIHSIHISTDCFVRNPKNYPVLSKRHQQFIKFYMRAQVSIVLKPKYLNDNLQDYYQYVTEYLFRNHDKLDKEEQIEVSYRNYLQSPL